MSEASGPILRVHDVIVEYPLDHHRVMRAVDGVSFELFPGEILGIVGESGSGKSSLGRAVAGFTPITSGKIGRGRGRPVATAGRGSRRRPHPVQMIFQESVSALDPRLPAWKSVGEALANGKLVLHATKKEATGHLSRVGLGAAHVDKRPDQLSGGERQRVAIARAIAAAADVLVCDEAVSALDVSVRATILNLFDELRRDAGVALIFISHDISVVDQLTDRILVMYQGKIVEAGRTADVTANPKDSYTKRLIEAVPKLERSRLPPSRERKKTASEQPATSLFCDNDRPLTR